MSDQTAFSEKLQRQFRKKGIQPGIIENQLAQFQKGFPDLEIDRPATIGDGIVRIAENEEPHLIERFHQAQNEGRIMKFVPASGAATRMFKTLQAMLGSPEKLTKSYFDSHPDDEDVAFTRTFIENIEVFAFYEDLVEVLQKHGLDADEVRQKGDYHTLLSFVLEDKGLGLASLPKALIPFHRYSDHRRTPFEEHLVEALEYTRSENGQVRIHFTISPEHEAPFRRRLRDVQNLYETGDTKIEVETSFQKPETDTIAADTKNRPFMDENDEVIFRPGGHGALLVNLEELKGDVVFIKNIDNVVPDHLKDTTYRYKKLIGGYLLSLQDKIFFYLKELDRGKITRPMLEEIVDFVRNELYVGIPEEVSGAIKGTTGETGRADATDNIREEDRITLLTRWLFHRLNRPIRVCGMVINEGEPGGGPFVVLHADGTTSLQIVESAQVNMEDPGQKKIFGSSTHFNPVDLTCSLRDYQGRPFELEPYRDPDTGFISMKSYQGRELKALELPGLWNGSMAFWNTVFVEVPPETFAPVKTVNDLLRDEHRND